jgi:hypothetical protein
VIVAHADRHDLVSIITAPGPQRASAKPMKKKHEKRAAKAELRREYDLSKLKSGVPGKYLDRYRTGTNLVLLSPNAVDYFPDDQSVNAALRALSNVAKNSLRRAR